ncbi:MAG: D-alanyl-D-alanine carboxypeptidase family protein [Gammaproteobacteria bacterium]
MRLPKLLRFFTVLLFVELLLAQTGAAEETIGTPAAPSVSAKSFVLQDFYSGRILAEKDPDLKLAPASLTKIMAVYVAFRELKAGHLKLDEMTTISKNAWRTTGSKMFVEVGKQVSINDLLHGIIIQSGNDASVALAEHIAGSESTFADMMNQHAKRLGMLNTHFSNSMGLPADDHYTTARDLAILTRALIKEFPQYYAWFKLKEYTYNNITQANRNKLLYRDASVDGVKTGYTEDAGYCLVASALRDDMRLISVLMGAPGVNDRAAESQTLLNYGFRFYEGHRLYEAKKPLTETRVWQGKSNQLHLGPAEDVYVTIPRRRYKDLKAAMTVDKKIIAPVAAGTALGNVTVKLGDATVADVPLVALEEIPEGNFLQKAYDQALLLLE